mmetsp:Transcript_27825/g.58051  ORF Transcript_27825/g.58051 Transcript_27825/m.58051 type:complete len:282 (-) Transcript_27825:536-1381(-)
MVGRFRLGGHSLQPRRAVDVRNRGNLAPLRLPNLRRDAHVRTDIIAPIRRRLRVLPQLEPLPGLFRQTAWRERTKALALLHELVDEAHEALLSGVGEDAAVAERARSELAPSVVDRHDASRGELFRDHVVAFIFVVDGLDVQPGRCPCDGLLHFVVGGHWSEVWRESYVPQWWGLFLLFRVSGSIPAACFSKKTIGAAAYGNAIVARVRRDECILKPELPAQSTVEHRVERNATCQTQVLFARFGFEMLHKVHGDGFEIGLDAGGKSNGIDGHFGRKLFGR